MFGLFLSKEGCDFFQMSWLLICKGKILNVDWKFDIGGAY